MTDRDDSSGSAAAVARRWLDVLARGATDEWSQIVSPDLAMHAVFMPGVSGPEHGREAAAAMVGNFWKAWKRFSFHDIEVHEAADRPGLVFMTARSEALTVWDAPYANTYVFRTVIADGQVVDHREYFDPLPVLEVFKDHLP